jgi:hypothetical protein
MSAASERLAQEAMVALRRQAQDLLAAVALLDERVRP